MVGDELLGTTETTWGQGLGVGTTLLATRSAFNLGLQVEDGLLTDWVNLDWPGLIHTGFGEGHNNQDDNK